MTQLGEPERIMVIDCERLCAGVNITQLLLNEPFEAAIAYVNEKHHAGSVAGRN